MNAIKFIKEWGLEHSRNYVAIAENDGDILTWEKELKRLVESVGLVGEYGGLYGAMDFISGYTEEQLAKPVYSPMLRIKQAIADYEAIYSIPQSVKKAILNLEMHL